MTMNEKYTSDFFQKRDPEASSLKAAAALEHALDIRKFEIELYWKRTTYFWAIIAATFAGYGAASTNTARPLHILLAGLGLILSCGWYWVNRGSKHWQQNWEQHVDMLENDLTGPLYKTTFTEAQGDNNVLKRAFTAPAPYSVSKINQIISLYVTGVWAVLFLHASIKDLATTIPATHKDLCIPTIHCYSFNELQLFAEKLFPWFAFLIPILICIAIGVWGKQSTRTGNLTVVMEQRTPARPISKRADQTKT